MTARVAVNGYGVIGKPVADAVRAMPDMELAGVTDVATHWRIRTTTRHDIALYAATDQAQTGMLAAGLPVAGQCEELLGRVDAVVDTTPKMVADADLRGVTALADAARDTAAAAVPAGTRGGPWWSCSPGTTWRPPGRIAHQLGIDTVIAEVLPGDKASKITELQRAGKGVAMVGDGVNDRPALATADLGIGIGAGTDVAIRAADVVLMRSDPLEMPIALRIGKGTLRKMRQNLGGAVGYNVIALPIAAGVFAPAFGRVLRPEIAALSMSGSSLIVAVNALLLKRLKLPALAPSALAGAKTASAPAPAGQQWLP